MQYPRFGRGLAFSFLFLDSLARPMARPRSPPVATYLGGTISMGEGELPPSCHDISDDFLLNPFYGLSIPTLNFLR